MLIISIDVLQEHRFEVPEADEICEALLGKECKFQLPSRIKIIV